MSTTDNPTPQPIEPTGVEPIKPADPSSVPGTPIGKDLSLPARPQEPSSKSPGPTTTYQPIVPAKPSDKPGTSVKADNRPPQ